MNVELLTLKQAKSKLTTLRKNNIDQLVHQLGCSGINLYKEHGDTTVLSELVHAMPKSVRGNALKYWVTKNANVKWNKDAHGGKGGYVKVSKKEPIKADLEQAMNEPFWVKPDQEASVFKGYSREAMVVSFLERMKKKEKELALLSEADQAKCDYNVSDETINMLIEMSGFETILEDDTNQEIEALEKVLQAG